MKHVTLSLKSIVESRAEVGSQLVAPGDSVLIIRGQPRWVLLKCPCGCDDEIPLNLDLRAGKAWRIYGVSDEQLTLFPSVWRDTGCLSHFFIRSGHILLCGGEENYPYRSPAHPDLLALVTRVHDAWPHDGWVQVVEVADLLGEIPWDVLDACRYLVRAGALVEGRGQLRSNFRRLRKLPLKRPH